MDVMNLKFAAVALAALAALSGPAGADGFIRGPGIKDMAVPAPIPVPAPVPVPEGFTYYLRGDIGYSWVGSEPGFTESGNLFGTGPAPFTAAAPFAFGQAPQFGPLATASEDIFFGGIGMGAYLTPRLRGDITIDFRGKQGFDASSSYAYATAAGDTIAGVVNETLRVRGTVTMVNGYFDLLPRGGFSPYIGAGIGFVYYDVDRYHYNQETVIAGPNAGASQTVAAASKDNTWGLAAALMAGVSIAFDHRWVLDIGYRAQFLDEVSVDLTPSGEQSKVTLGDHWEHQARVGLRLNIW